MRHYPECDGCSKHRTVIPVNRFKPVGDVLAGSRDTEHAKRPIASGGTAGETELFFSAGENKGCPFREWLRFGPGRFGGRRWTGVRS